MANINTKEAFQGLELKNISQVYKGKRNNCRCGCGGTYITTSFAKHDRSEANDKLALRRLEQAKKLVAEGAEVEFGGSYIDVKTASTANGVDRTLTFYIDELKEVVA